MLQYLVRTALSVEAWKLVIDRPKLSQDKHLSQLYQPSPTARWASVG